MFHRRHRRGSWSPPSDLDDEVDELNDIYGQTPPRTRYNRRQRERKQRMSSGDNKHVSPKETHCKPTLCRRNTLDTIIFNKMCDQADKDQEKENAEEVAKENNRKCKRSLKLSRHSERDLKLDIDIANQCSQITDRSSSTCSNMKVLCGVIETRNRFRCLQSKPVDAKKKLESIKSTEESIDSDEIQFKNLKEREIFHDTFSYLIRLGSTDWDKNCRRQMSSEETRWQNELKDLIWLELQAFHADRNLVAQDEYLCKQRESIGPLLTEILNYRYDPTSSLVEHGSATSSSNDSGFEGSLTPSSCQESGLSEGSEIPGIFQLCTGCLSMHCRSCLRSQTTALKQVEDLLNRLEMAEALFPSSHAFGLHYTQYKSPEFIGRVKAMCLWYNMTRHHRLKVQILGKLLMLLDNNQRNYSELIKNNIQESKLFVKLDISLCENVDDLAKSTNSKDLSFDTSREFGMYTKTVMDFANCNRLTNLDFYLMEFEPQSYRKYIEEVLKTRGLSKSLNFLERLHKYVLRKASIALTNYDDDETLNEEYEGDKELRRYGMWSTESKALNLPSYASAFVFLSRVPLDVVHEFLRMRLEQKPEQPGPLSIRQLMREMREGLRIACIYRNRFIAHSKTASAWAHSALDCDNIDDFDENLKSVFQVYLNYLKQWIEMMQDSNYHKCLIDDEWCFVKSIVCNVKEGYDISGQEFCDINRIMVEQIKDFLHNRPREILESMEMIGDDDSATKFQLMSLGREWQGMFVEAREKTLKTLIMARTLRKDIDQWPKSSDLENAIENLKKSILSLKSNIVDAIEKFRTQVDDAEEPKSENDRLAYRTRVKEILHQAYRMGFDCHREIYKIFNEDERQFLTRHLIKFAMRWMEFVKTRCEKGRGLRPRWANHGLEYLMFVSEPARTQFLTDEEFDALKANVDRCIAHVIGVAGSDFNLEKDTLKKLPRSRAPSPAQHQKSITVSKSKENLKLTSPLPSNEKETISLMIPELNYARHQRLIASLRNLENKLDDKRRSAELIGRVTDRKSVDNVKIKVRRVTFTWQRGIKIGQGRFGKVYTVVNNQTGELLAMKEVQLQPGDHWAIRRVAEELQIFEGIIHTHLVRYYGIEIHHEEMLIFMEFCAEGTLESLVATSGLGLPEILVRKYTNQLLSAISILHSHGIVHRDIKTANIFLTDQGNCIKLGDFGSAVQIKAHTTMPGELKGFVGTQAYMAPEVFMKTETGGHGRAADIWSLGCCVIEMGSGKRPWAEFDSNYQIMFKVGMGESPLPPKSLCKEGIDFIAKCLQHDPTKRPIAKTLLSHPFARHYDDVSADLNRIVS